MEGGVAVPQGRRGPSEALSTGGPETTEQAGLHSPGPQPVVVRAHALLPPPPRADRDGRAGGHLRRRGLRQLRRALRVRADRPRPHPPGPVARALLRHGLNRARPVHPRHLGDPHLDGGRRLRRVRLDHRGSDRRGGRRLLRRLDGQPSDAHHRPRADAAPSRRPAHRDGSARPGQPVARLAHPGLLLLDDNRPRRSRRLPLAAREGVRRGGEGLRAPATCA